MGSSEVCVGSGAPPSPPHGPSHASFPDVLNAVAGDTLILLDDHTGRADGPSRLRGRPAHFPGSAHKLTVVPHNGTAIGTALGRGSRAAPPSWFLLDSGVGTFAPLRPAEPPRDWRIMCGGTRVSFMSPDGAPVEVVWTAPAGGVPGAGAGELGAPAPAPTPVLFRVAAATSMGNITINAATLDPAPTPALPPGQLGYMCTTLGGSNTTSAVSAGPRKQCQSVPPGTPGAVALASCEARCLAGAAQYSCGRCAHVYDSGRDGGGLAFEDLPDTWKCPICGALKSAYTKQIVSGRSVWSHV